MLPTARELLRLAEAGGFDTGALEKVIRLAELLDGVERQPELKGSLALKGGTALNLFAGPPRRLSVDLDFNFIGAEDRDQMLALKPRVEHLLEAIARSQGYSLQKSAPAHAGSKLFLGYTRISDGQADRVELDVNYLHRVCLLPTERRRMWRPDGESPEATLLSWAEIAAGKLVALLDRAAPRDAWDVAQVPGISPWPWPPVAFRSIFIALAGSLPRGLPDYGEHSLARITETEVSRLLWPMLIRGERPKASSLREAAWAVLSPLLALSSPEREYCERLQRGELVPELLFPGNAEIAERARRHPGLQWKAQHAGEHARKSNRPKPWPQDGVFSG